MSTVEISEVTKSYAEKAAVADLSFSVHPGEIFGLIGPNGAGKTSTIRMMMDIIRPDAGTITILGERMCAESKSRIGFLPEERGLYRKLRVIDTLLYLASLKGMDRRRAEERADVLLDRVGMAAHKARRIEELSKGMGQLIQFVVTIIHDPELVILDEPFSGLDPVNTETVKGVLIELREQGKAVLLSTHQMNDVEELCDRVLMIDEGRAVLYGDLAEIKERYSRNSILLDADGELGDLHGVASLRDRGGSRELVLEPGFTPQKVLEQLVRRGVGVNRFEVVVPPLREIFLRVVGRTDEAC